MWDVIEHLSMPFDSIKKVSKMLRSGGYSFLLPQILNGFDRKIFKESWLGCRLPRHLYLFPDSLLRQFLHDQGLEVLDRFCFTGSHGSLYLDLAYWSKNHPSSFVKWLLSKRLLMVSFSRC